MSRLAAHGETQRAVEAAREMADFVWPYAAGGSAAEIAQAKELLDSGTTTQAEFDAIKAKAIA